mgnify:CR=1 FL=1
MKQLFSTAFLKFCRLIACTAILLAVSSVNSTCVFMLYQPNVPEELR